MASRTFACSMAMASAYDTAYAGTWNLMMPCRDTELHAALRRLAATARDEAAWGVVDALADLVRQAADPSLARSS